MILTAEDAQQLDPSEVWSDAVDALRTAGLVALITLAVVFLIILITGIAIAKKAGYSGWWGALAVLVPPLGVILTLLFAVAKWPALKERDEALGVLEANQLTLASHERRAIKELERKQKVEESARKRMEKAQVERQRVEAERQRFQPAAVADAAPAAPDDATSHASADTDAAAPGTLLEDGQKDVTSVAPAPTAPAAPKPAPKAKTRKPAADA